MKTIRLFTYKLVFELGIWSKTTWGVIGQKTLACAVFHRAIIYVCKSHADGTQLEDRGGRGEAEHAMIFQSSPLRKGFNGLHTSPPSFHCPVFVLCSVFLQ